MTDTEKAILSELSRILGDSTLTFEEVAEWDTDELTPLEGETQYYLPNCKVYVCLTQRIN